MLYSAEISRRNPTCFLFLVDQSASMADSFGSSPGIQKAQFVSDALNKTLQNIIIQCAKSDGIRDFFWIGMIGYGETVGPALSGVLAERDLVPVSEVANNPARIEERVRKEPDGAGGIIEVAVKFPVWFEPRASGGTPMCEALSAAQAILQHWIAEHRDSFPPVVLHITDGESTDGDPNSFANYAKDLSTADGNVLLFNLHASSHRWDPIRFPNSAENLPDDPFARMLFDLSSTLSPHMIAASEASGYRLQGGSRGFVFNAGIEEVVDFLRIGTQPANLR